MGLSDFSDAIFSIGELEGQQNLILPNLNDYETEPDDLVTNWVNFPDTTADDMEDGNKYFDILATTPERNPMHIIEPHHDDLFFTGTDGSAILEIVTFPITQKITKNDFARLIQKGNYKSRYYKEYNYSWDNWDFIDPETDEKLGYDDSTSQMMDIIWKVLDKKGLSNAKSLKNKHPNEQIWIRNYSKHTFDNYINTNELNPLISNVELSYVCYLLNIDYIGITRLDAFIDIKKHLNIPKFNNTLTAKPNTIIEETILYNPSSNNLNIKSVIIDIENAELDNTIPISNITESKPNITESKPDITESKLNNAESNSDVIKSNPIITESKPIITESKPIITESKPIITESKLDVIESKPIITESKLDVIESKPDITESKPTNTESKPTDTKSKPTDTKSKPNQIKSYKTINIKKLIKNPLNLKQPKNESSITKTLIITRNDNTKFVVTKSITINNTIPKQFKKLILHKKIPV